jgi:hypothetical protein
MSRFYFIIIALMIFLVPNVYAQSTEPANPGSETGSEISPESETSGEKVSSGAEIVSGEGSFSKAEKPSGVKPSSDAQRDPGAQTQGEKLTISSVPATGNGGCLIATAAFGSELAPQVQQLRELRDNTVMHTQSGTVFMSAFNSVYYSFAPTVADWERQNPVFKEIVKATITPLITTLSILNYVDIDSDAKMISYGVGIILLNIGMYFVAPAFVISRLKNIK